MRITIFGIWTQFVIRGWRQKGVQRFFGDPTPIQRNYLVEEFRTDAEAAGIAASVHIQVGAKDGLSEARWVQSISATNPDWPAAQVVFCDLTAPDLVDQLDEFQKLPSVRGLRQIVGRAPEEDNVTGSNTLLDDPKFLEGLREAGRRGLSFDLQLIPELMVKTTMVLEKVPEVKVALCHAGSPHDRSAEGLQQWSQELKSLSRLPNVWCKLSGLGMFDHGWSIHSIKPIVETCLEQFGPERYMYGSNFPVDSLYSDYGTLVGAYRELIPVDDHDAVFGKTASAFYRL